MNKLIDHATICAGGPTLPKKGAVTFADFCTLIRDDQKADLLDGVIHMASPENLDANKLFVWLLHILGGYVEERDLGDVYGSRVAFRLDDHNSPEPDIGFVARERLPQPQTGFVEGPPDAAFEIISPESVHRDYVKKRAKYEAAGVREYWLIDDIDEKVTLLRLAKSGAYKQARPLHGALHSQVIAGFYLRPAWLWQRPRPKKQQVLQEILRATREP